ncbi:hypothetical protein B2K_38665 [Paenibacillus mucilaginosus K02]|uniref:Uncharacterized protein n=2 Tax=Paenibacillus mucilaginosus TaxID=61624 RepID=R9UPN5_9BACL|nr:hypothetical protein B2K_38665 [Paenibacillus mucilaginosus K02]
MKCQICNLVLSPSVRYVSFTQRGRGQVIMALKRNKRLLIGIGDPAAKAVAAYGDRCYRRTEQGALVIRYIDKQNHTTLEFWLDGATVSRVRPDSDELK